MKLVLVGPVYPFRGGIVHYTTMLARTLSAEHQVEVISFTRQYPGWLFPGKSDRDPSEQTHTVPARYLLDSLSPLTWWRTAEYIIRQRPDVVLLQWWSTYWGPLLWTLARQLRQNGLAPLFLVHNVLPHEPRPWDRWLTRRVLGQGRACLVQTEAERGRLLALLPGMPVQIFPHPVDVMLIPGRLPRAEARQQLGLPLDQPLLLFFGLVRPYKGLHFLLDALGALRQQGQTPGLLVAGQFWDKVAPYEEQIRRLGLSDQVRLVNRYIPNEELGRYFSAADVFVAPYLDATASGAYNLALGFGLPIIATFGDEAMRSAGEQLTIVPPQDVPALASAIAAFCAGPASAAPAAAGQRPVTDQAPTWKAVGELIEILMQQTAPVAVGEKAAGEKLVTTNGRRVLVIGMDGATFDLIQPWVGQGHLPNLAKLMADGAWGPLASTMQPATAPAWTTFMTGLNQGGHGLYDFVKRRAGSYNVEVTNATHIGAPSIFDLLSQAGRRVISVNVPYTFPPHAVNGIMLGGPFAVTVTAELVYPRSYFEKLKALVPDYFVLPDYNPRAADPMADYAGKLLQEVAQRERVSLDLLQSEAWDLFMVVFMATDEVHHTFWACMAAPDGDPLARYRDVVRSVYVRIDQAIGNLRAAAAHAGEPEPTVLVVSDHGAGPFHGMINLNHFLAQAGLLHFHTGSANAIGRLRSAAAQRVAYAYRHSVPARWREAIRNSVGANRFATVKGEFESVLATSAVNWNQTQAYSLGVGGNILVNLRGREPAGIVEPGAAYERVCLEVERGLLNLVDPQTGVKLVKKVHRRGDIYSGKFLDQAPDLIIEWSDYAYWGRGGYDHPNAPVFQAQRHFDFSDQPLTGSHRPFGILIAGGPNVQRQPNVTGARLIDIAPTLLNLLGVEPTYAFDGQVLEPLAGQTLPEAQPGQGPVGSAPAPDQFDYTPDEAQMIADHLRSLGYL